MAGRYVSGPIRGIEAALGDGIDQLFVDLLKVAADYWRFPRTDFVEYLKARSGVQRVDECVGVVVVQRIGEHEDGPADYLPVVVGQRSQPLTDWLRLW